MKVLQYLLSYKILSTVIECGKFVYNILHLDRMQCYQLNNLKQTSELITELYTSLKNIKHGLIEQFHIAFKKVTFLFKVSVFKLAPVYGDLVQVE